MYNFEPNLVKNSNHKNLASDRHDTMYSTCSYSCS